LDENEFASVLFSNPRLMPYHLLIAPKRHVERPWELAAREQRAIWALILKWQKWLCANVAAGCDVRENYRPFYETEPRQG